MECFHPNEKYDFYGIVLKINVVLSFGVIRLKRKAIKEIQFIQP